MPLLSKAQDALSSAFGTEYEALGEADFYLALKLVTEANEVTLADINESLIEVSQQQYTLLPSSTCGKKCHEGHCSRPACALANCLGHSRRASLFTKQHAPSALDPRHHAVCLRCSASLSAAGSATHAKECRGWKAARHSSPAGTS